MREISAGLRVDLNQAGDNATQEPAQIWRTSRDVQTTSLVAVRNLMTGSDETVRLATR